MTSSPLALLGGAPLVEQPGPHFTWPPITDHTRAAVAAQLDTAISVYDRSGVVADLEDRLCAYLGVAHTVLTSSGTVGLYSAYAACGIGPGDEVIVPAYTFLATATPLFHLGAVPVPADLPALAAITAEHGIALLEDASHAHGAAIGERKVGTGSQAGAFSLNGPKPLSAGEGGFVATDDETFYRLLLHGHYNKRCRTEIPADHPLHRYATTGMGLKLRIHPLAAAIALDQFDH